MRTMDIIRMTAFQVGDRVRTVYPWERNVDGCTGTVTRVEEVEYDAGEGHELLYKVAYTTKGGLDTWSSFWHDELEAAR